MFNELNNINERPKVFSEYTAAELWTENYVSSKMLEMHLDGESDPASRKQEFMDRSFEWMISHFNIHEGKKVIDFGCGPGFYTTCFALAGADVTGVDFSERSIAYAQDQAIKKDLKINYVLADYLEFETETKYDLITLIYCDLCPLSPSQRQKLLRMFRKILKDDGKLILDVFSLHFLKQMEEMSRYDVIEGEGFWSPGKHHVFQNRFLYKNEQVMLDKYVILEENRKREIFNWLQFYGRETIKQELTTSGFEVKEVYADVCGNPYSTVANEIAVVASKR